jgi:hypothetical protein
MGSMGSRMQYRYGILWMGQMMYHVFKYIQTYSNVAECCRMLHSARVDAVDA